MPFTSGAGAPLYYEVAGPEAAPPVLMIMGLSFSSRAWGALPQRLAERHRVVTFDNRGTGRSALAAGTRWPRFRISDLAEDARAVLDAAGIRSAAHVFGISMGGLIAQELALRNPDRVESLALGATFGSFVGGDRARWPALTNLFIGSLQREKGAARVERLLVSRRFHEASRDRVRDWLRHAEPSAPVLAFAQVTAAVAHHATPRLSQLAARTLVLTGDEDQIIPPSNSARLARALPRAELRILPETGHAFPLEREVETVDLLSEFFSRERSATRSR